MLNLDDILLSSIKKLIKNSTSDKKFKVIINKHKNKLHFIPFEYRVLGGILQSMNIQFGNFIEELMCGLVKNSGYEILTKYSGKKSNNFKISNKIDNLIDTYITNAQTKTNFDILKEFRTLQYQILNDKSIETINLRHDIDLLFKDKNNKIYYLEIKYNDDHDTGKFMDINRKFIKTYAYLVRELNQDIKPILFYFNNKKMKVNIYLDENLSIYRGKRFFDEFLNFDYEDLKNKLENVSSSKENIEIFNNLYKNIMKLNKNNLNI